MVKLVAQFRRPRDPERLLAAVLGQVVPHCREIPGVLRVDLASADEGLGAGPLHGYRSDRRGPPFLIAELYFPDRATFDDALASPEAESALGELLDVCEREVNIFLAEVRTDDE